LARISELEPGDLFAGFRVLRKLSEGGMGAVYVVSHEATARQRALKLMHPEMIADAGLRERFIQEARIGARVESEHIVDVVDAGVDGATGIPWLAMELLQGEDLSVLVARRGRLELREVGAIFEQLCHAVQAAHAAGIVHRDLKPENIFLASTKRAGHAFTIKVLDFGIAKLIEEARTSSNTGTLGTPFWMAPEQTDRHAQISAATDVWALGLIAYRLLTGHIFWRGADGEHPSLPIFLRELVVDEIPTASQRAKEQGVAGTLPQGFDDWFAGCVARESSRRFPNAGAVQTAFAGLVGARSSVEPGSGLPAASVVVRTGDTAGGQIGESSTALGSARTMHDPENDVRAVDDAPLVLPKAGFGRVWAFGALGCLVVCGLFVMGLRKPPVTPANRASDEPRVVAVADNRCPKAMVPIAEGTFSMGSADGAVDERPVRTVAVAAFCMDLTEVLVGEYASCVDAKKCAPPSKTASWPQIKPEDSALWGPACNANHPERADHPVNCVSWDDSDAFCRWAGKRLPTEAEWEYAARGRDGRVYPWGNTGPTREHVNACGEECAHGDLLRDHDYLTLYPGNDGFQTTAPARSFGLGKTPDGIYDLAGNVLEWTSSSYCKYGEPDCASPWKVARGGAWDSDVRDGVKAARRSKNARDAKAPDLGFRCAL